MGRLFYGALNSPITRGIPTPGTAHCVLLRFHTLFHRHRQIFLVHHPRDPVVSIQLHTRTGDLVTRLQIPNALERALILGVIKPSEIGLILYLYDCGLGLGIDADDLPCELELFALGKLVRTIPRPVPFLRID